MRDVDETMELTDRLFNSIRNDGGCTRDTWMWFKSLINQILL